MPAAYFRNMTPVSTRPAHGLSTASDGTNTWGNSRILQVAPCDISAPALSFRNYYDGDKATGIGTITVKAAIEYNGLTYPVYFRGGTSVAIEAGAGGVVSEPAGVPLIPRGASYYIRTNVLVTSGQKWPHMMTSRSGDGEGSTKGTGGNTDQSTSGTITAASEGVYTAEAVLCANPSISGASTRIPVVAGLGDSVTYGIGEDSPETDKGYLIRAINNQFATIKLDRGGSTANLWVNSPTGTSGSTRRLPQLQAASTFVEAFGVNDLNGSRTLLQLQTDCLAIWNQAKACGVERVFRTTLTPWTTSTDSWATTTNQTVKSWEATRVAFNEWIRNRAPIDPISRVPTITGQPNALLSGQPGHPLYGYFDTADAVETSRNSGIWRVGYVYVTDAQGVHPSPDGAAAMATAIDTTLFV